MNQVRIAIAALMLAASHAPALAQEGCDKFAWQLTRERTLLAATDKTSVKAGETLATIPTAALSMHLQPAAEAEFVMPPERKPRTERWFGGALKFPALEKAGIYQVTLSEDAWIDVVQDGRYARSVGSTGRSDCPGLRKSVRIDLHATPFALQISGVVSDSIAVAIGARE